MRILGAKIFWNVYPLQKPCNIHAYSVIIHAINPRLRKSRIGMVMHDDVWICMDTSDNYLSPPLPSEEPPSRTCRCHRRHPPSLQYPLATLSQIQAASSLWPPIRSPSPGCSCRPPTFLSFLPTIIVTGSTTAPFLRQLPLRAFTVSHVVHILNDFHQTIFRTRCRQK
jgi:hypothetical protein